VQLIALLCATVCKVIDGGAFKKEGGALSGGNKFQLVASECLRKTLF
jgi:hypothetical protein